MNSFKVGTPLLEVIDKVSESDISQECKDFILNFCRSELEYGDSVISNELELTMLNSWALDVKNISMPIISDKYKLTDSFSLDNQTYEEYKSSNGECILRCVGFDNNGNVKKVRLSYMSGTLKELLKNGGIEDIFVDYNNDGISDARMIQKTTIDDSGTKLTKMLYDLNMDGKFD